MARVALTLPARDDLEAIWDYVARDTTKAADRLIDQIHDRCELYATQPAAGVPGDRFREGVRYFAVSSYVVFYRPIDDGILVVRVFHGARNLDDLFSESED